MKNIKIPLLLVLAWILSALLGTFLMVSCSLMEVLEPIVPVDPVLPIDTIETPIDTVPEPIVICEVLQEFTDPSFITGTLRFDIIPFPITWMYGDNPTTLDAHFTDYKFYMHDKSIAVIVKGTNNTASWNGKLWIRDGSGAKNALSFSRQSLSMGGAVSFEGMKLLQTEFKSVYWLNYKNMHLDSLQYDELISFQVDSFCKEGRERIDLRDIPVAQSRIDQCFEVGWENVWF